MLVGVCVREREREREYCFDSGSMDGKCVVSHHLCLNPATLRSTLTSPNKGGEPLTEACPQVFKKYLSPTVYCTERSRVKGQQFSGRIARVSNSLDLMLK